jgi:hypothetical protein
MPPAAGAKNEAPFSSRLPEAGDQHRRYVDNHIQRKSEKERESTNKMDCEDIFVALHDVDGEAQWSNALNGRIGNTVRGN